MKLKLFILLILTLGLSLNLSAQTVEFSEASCLGTSAVGDFEKCTFEFGGSQLEISEKGRGKRSSTVFQLPKESNEILSRVVYFAAHKNDLILLYEISAGGEGAGYIARFDGKTLKLKWKANVSGFNVGKGLSENNFAYLTAIGFVGKINLLTGKYVWKHDNLYGWNRNSGAFNSFELPELEGSNVIFTEKNVNDQTNIIVVNKTTGKIVRTILDGK
jgi:hypothetical protein